MFLKPKETAGIFHITELNQQCQTNDLGYARYSCSHSNFRENM